MDPELQKKIDEARAAGYTDEEIQAHLNPQTPVQEPKSRSDEYIGMAEFALPAGFEHVKDIAKVAIPTYGAYKLGKYAIDQMNNRNAPPAAGPQAPVAPGNTPGGGGSAPIEGQGRVLAPEEMTRVAQQYPNANPQVNANPEVKTPVNTAQDMARVNPTAQRVAELNRAKQIAAEAEVMKAQARAAQAAATVGGEAGLQGSEFLGNMAKKFAPLANMVSPVLNNPVVRGVARVAGTPLLAADLLTHSGGLNTGEDEAMRRIHAQQDAMMAQRKLPARAHGGPVTQGQPYLVGERGPEIMVPKTAGHIIPHDHLHQAVKVAKPHRHKSNSPQEADARKKGYGEWISPNSGNRHTMETLPNGIHREVTYERSTGRARQAEYWHPHGHKHN